MDKAKVFFTKNITPEALVAIYEKLGRKLEGKIGIKISTGEAGGNNYLKPELIGQLVKKLGGTIVECNTAYGGSRANAKKHLKTAEEHGFTAIADVDIMDADGEVEIPCDGKHLDVDIVGKTFKNYDAFVNLAHFKGHAMGGFGGALKNQSIGFASANGKAYIHSAGATRNTKLCWVKRTKQEDFLEAMAEAAKAVADQMGENIVYINVMNNLSVDCDCDSHPEDPCVADIGILASLDPVALDQACVDQIWNSTDPGRDHFVERVERQNGRHILSYAEAIGLGTCDYELINIDEE